MLYHKDLGFPKNVSLPQGTFGLTYGHHARQAAASDRYGDVSQDLPATIDTTLATVVELEILDGRIAKIVYRDHFNDELDLVFAIIPGQWFVKTVWVNVKSDPHHTLDRGRYQAA